jgi:hypothetical protein
MDLFALGGCPLGYLLVSLTEMNSRSELTILLRDVGRNNLDRRGSIEGGVKGVWCVCVCRWMVQASEASEVNGCSTL